MHTSLSESGRGFSLALVTPAIFSTVKQWEREAAPEMHALANMYDARQGASQAALLTAVEADVLRRFGIVFLQQMGNGAFFLAAARTAVSLGGVTGGVLAQVGITMNTMFHPQQTQRFNPSRLLAQLIGPGGDWTQRLSATQKRDLACLLGRGAAKLGYGASGQQRSQPQRPRVVATA
jgi:hypothetical protein